METSNNTSTPAVTIAGVLPPASCIYEYGVRFGRPLRDLDARGRDARGRSDKADESAHRELFYTQAWLANRFYNDLVEFSREQAEIMLAVLNLLDPTLDALDEQITAHYEQRKAAKAAGDHALYAVLEKQIKELNIERQSKRHAARKASAKTLKPLEDALNVSRKESAVYVIRNRYVREQGLYWGTAGAIADAFSKAWAKQWARFKMPRFRRFAERDPVLTDPVNDRPGGLTQEELYQQFYRLKIAHCAKPGDSVYVPFTYRAGLNGEDIHGTVLWNRDLPPDARITESRLIGRRTDRHWRFYLQLVLKLPEDTPLEKTGRRRIGAFAVGWYLDGETRRLGVVRDNTGIEEVIRLPQDILSDLDRCETLQSLRDSARDDIVAWLHKQANRLKNLPEPLAEELAAILELPAQHVTQARLARLAFRWTDDYPMTAVKTRERLQQWRKCDAQRWTESSHLRKRTLRRRKNFYCQLARDLCERYHTLLMQPVDLKGAATLKDEHGEHTELPAVARAGRVAVALSECLMLLNNAAGRFGTRVVTVHDAVVDPCSRCGVVVPELHDVPEATCANCGAELERRSNTAANLLKRYRGLKEDVEQATYDMIAQRVAAAEKREAKKLARANARRRATAERRAAV